MATDNLDANVNTVSQPEAAPISAAPSAPAPVAGTAAESAAAAPAPTPGSSPWANILRGALWGLAGASQKGPGRGGFGAGLGMGVEGFQKGEAQQQQQQALAKQLQFESARAADSHILALKQAQEADAATADHQVQLISHQQAVNEYALEHGDSPVFTISGKTPSEMHAQANGGLQTLSDRNGGTIPQVTTTNAPLSTGSDSHAINVYSAPTASALQQNPSGYLALINEARKVDGGQAPISSTSDLNVLGGQMSKGNAYAGVKQMVAAAQERLYGVPATDSKPGVNEATSAHLEQQLNTYKQRNDADPKTVKLLQTQLDTFKSAMTNQQSLTSGNAASAAAQKTTAEANAKAGTPLGQAELAEKQTSVEKFNEENVVAFDPNYPNTDGTKGGNVVVTRSQAKDQGLTNFYAKGVDPSLLNGIVAGFNDVQNKINQLASVATDAKTMGQVDGKIAAQLLKDAGEKIGLFGIELNTESTSINTRDYMTQLANANPATRAYVTSLIAAHEAITQLPRLQTFGKSSRMTQQQMEAAVKMLPAPADDANMAERKMTSLQTAIDPLRKQVPHMPGAELMPSWLEERNKQSQAQAAPAIRNVTQTRTVDPFAGFAPGQVK